ncbi:MAG: S-layer homology domain-containing protein [Candidatus Altimarinota bacterium]
MKGSSFAGWQRWVSVGLVTVIAANTGLFSGAVYAQTYEVKLDDFRSESLEDQNEYGLVNVLVEGGLLEDRSISGHVRQYCERIQEVLGTVCTITPWEGESASRVVEALQQLYFEGLEVEDGIGKLVGLVVVGDVPLPVVYNGQDSFPSLFPYTDFVKPAYVFDPEQELFVKSSSSQSQAEIWHGLIRPPGEGEERLEALRGFFEKNALFYEGDDIFSVFRNEIGFHDQFWENDAFDNENKKWYLKKMSLLDRIMHYRYNGEWLQELSGEAVDRLNQLTARTFDDASVEVERTGTDDVNSDLGFSPGDARTQANASIGRVNQGNEDVEEYGGGRLEETVPDSYSPGPIRNFLKDYVHVVQRYISGTAELMATAGRRQSTETLASLLTKMDRFYSTVVFAAMQDFEAYVYQQAEVMALDFELIDEFEKQNDFYTEEVTSAFNQLQGEIFGNNVRPPYEEVPKSSILKYGSKIFHRFVNGVPVDQVQSVEDCSLERGSNFVSDEGEFGRAVTLNRKDNPLTAQDISGASGRKAQDEIKQMYKDRGYCSYMVKDQCVPGGAKVPLLDFGASEVFEGDNDYRRCFNHDGPNVPEVIDQAQFHSIPSIVNHNEPRGETVMKMLEAKLAHYFPLDAVRHVSFLMGGIGQYADVNVARIEYPNFFELKAVDREVVAEQLNELVEAKERELRKVRVEANWKRFEQYLGFSTPVQGRADFWNYQEIQGFESRFQNYKVDVIKLLRPELDPAGALEDFEVVEQYLIGPSVSQETEEAIQELITQYFPTSLAQQNLDLQCEYSYDVPPVDIDINLPKVDVNDLLALQVPQIEIPKFNPPSISRECDNKVAKSTVNVVRSLRSFYFSLGGVEVDISILHDADQFVEVLDPVAVILYFTPAPPPLPPNTNQLAAIRLFEQQVEKLIQDAPQPLTRISKVVKPVLLQEPGELEALSQKHFAGLQEALHWLHLGIEGKHREGLSLLSKDKELLYLVMDGEPDALSLALPSLEGDFEEDANIASPSDLLDRVRDGERALQEQQEENRRRRELERRASGEKPSKCGDSVPLLEWPGAVSCWLEEIVAGPLIVPADETAPDESEEGGSVNSSASSSASAAPGEIEVAKKVLTMRDRTTASINLPLEMKVDWQSSGSVRVVPETDGKVSVTPVEPGAGTIRASFDDGSGPRTVSAVVQVVTVRASLQQVSSGDLQIGSDEALSFVVEVQDEAGESVDFDGVLQIASDSAALRYPAEVSVVDGKGSFEFRPAMKAGVSELWVGSDVVAPSTKLYVNTVSGVPAKVLWDFGDAVVGLDRMIEGTLMVQDAFGNPYRAEGLRLELVWDEDLTVNGQTGGRGTFFVVAGQLPLRVSVGETVYEELQSRQQASYGYEPNPFGAFDSLRTFVRPRIRVAQVDGFPQMQLPNEVALDVDPQYRVRFENLPQEVLVGEPISVQLQVLGEEGSLLLNHKQFIVQKEFAGEVEYLPVSMKQSAGRVQFFAGASAGTIRLVIDDPDFGSLVQEIEVIGQTAADLQLDEASYVNGLVEISVSGRDALGNPALLPGNLATLVIRGAGAEVLFEKAVVIENGRLEISVPLVQQPDRIRMELSVEGFERSFSEVLALKQVLTAEQLQTLPWETPYTMLIGGGYGDYRVDGSVAQAMLFGPASKLQAITTEITPHSTLQKVAQVWPSGRTSVGPEMTVKVIWENLKPVLVYSDLRSEVGRLFLNPRSLGFEVRQTPDASFTWTKALGRGKSILVPEAGVYQSITPTSGDLLSPEGQRLISFDNQQVEFHDLAVQTEVFDDAGDVLVLEFSRQQQVLARWYLHFDAEEIVTGKIRPLEWQFTGDAERSYENGFFYAGESTLDERGLAVYQKGEKVRNSIGQGRSGLDDARENNGQGFEGDDKSALSFLAGNTVGESTLLQSEGIVNLGDPVISLRQVKHRDGTVGLTPAVPETPLLAESDFSVGQLVYAPEEGQIEQLLRVDVEGDGDDDLVIVLRIGERTVLRYLEGHGEGQRWGQVSNLLDLGKEVEGVQILQKKSFVVRYASGQVVVEQNLQGRYVRQVVDFSVLNRPKLLVTDLQVQDFDRDGFDDLLFLTGDREVWVWYGSQTLQGVQFGIREADRKLLKVLAIRLKDPEHLKTAAWLLTSSTPSLLQDCQTDALSCQSKYFRAYTGDLGQQPSEEIDRLGVLIEQSQAEPSFEQTTFAEESQRSLVRLDQLESYASQVEVELLNGEEGTGMRLGQQLDFEVRVLPRRTEEVFVLRYDLGTDFSLVGSVECDGCGEDLRLTRTPDSLWSLEGRAAVGRAITLRFTVEYRVFPDFSFQVMSTNDDVWPDIGLNVSTNTSDRMTVFESRGARDFAEILFGGTSAGVSSSTESARTLSDLMRGVGIENTSPDEIKRLLLQQQQDIEANAGELFDTLHADENADGYPDVYQENPSLFDPEAFGSDQANTPSRALLDLFSFLVPKASAQGTAPSGPPPQGFNFNLFSGLENASMSLDNVAQDVQRVINALKCSRGCLPLPMNFAFLAPGPINVFGTPAGFDPGVPVFGVSAAPFFVWPPLVPYQATQFRFYISPTLTGGVGLSVCLGPYLLGQCMVFALPLNQLGGEAICDAAKQGLQFIIQGIYQAVGQVNAAVDQFQNQVNQTGVVKARKPTKVDEVEGIIGVSLAGGVHDQGINPLEPKVFLNPIPKIFVDWWDRQWEEIINSLTDLPDITVRLPDPTGAFGDADYWDKINARVSGETLFNLQQLYDLINSLPIVSLHPQVLTIQIPWIEPGILTRIEQSLYEFLFQFLLELVAFLKSFNLPCNITVVRGELFRDIRSQVAEGRAQSADEEIRRLKSQLEDSSVDLEQTRRDLEAFVDREGISSQTQEKRAEFMTELTEKRTEVERLNGVYDDLQQQIQSLEQPKQLRDIFPVLGDVLSQTSTFWGKQLESFSAASAAAGADREIAEALRSCVAIQVGADLIVNVDPFVNGIKKNLEALEVWKKFPRELAKYLNVFEFYIQEVIKLIDQLTSVVLKWWGEFERKLDLWIDAIYSFQQFIALIQLLLDILKGYNKKCGLCTSDRLTLKELILKILFGVVPKFPIIDFPTWPDIRLDFSNVQLGIDVAVPVFDVKTIDLKWPRLPQIKFPRFGDVQLSAAGNLSLGVSVTLPEVPLVIPAPPALPPLPPLPNIPQIHLPNLPPAPEVPSILESLLPLMKIIQTVLDIWCLVNKALIPVDEKLLKTQIENLTNRSLNLILPIDLLLEFDILPGDLLNSLVPFDTIDVQSTFRAGIKVDPLPNLQQTIDQQFHQPMNLFLQQIDQWVNQLRQSSQQGLNTLSGDLQNMVDAYSIQQGIQIDGGANLNLDVDQDFSELINSLQPPDLHSEVFQQRQDQIASYYGSLKQGFSSFEDSLRDLQTEHPEALLQRLATLPSDHVLASSSNGWLKQQMADEKRRAVSAPEQMVEKRVAFVEKPLLLAQLDQARSSLEEVQEELLGTNASSLDQWGTAIVRDGEVRRIQDYPLEDPAVAVWDNDVFLGYEKAVYLKSLDGTARRTGAYTGRVRQLSLSSLQRTSVHQLQAQAVSSPDAGGDAASVRWSWDSPGVEEVELTVWDTVGKAQRLDSRHLRFYLSSDESDLGSEYFSAVTLGFTLVEGQEFLARNTIRLRFGNDQLIIPAGVRFQIPSLLLREVRFAGDGTVQFENTSGAAWIFSLDEEVALEMSGIAQLQARGETVRIPAFSSRPVITDMTGSTEGALKSRVPVARGETLPAGVFYAVRSSILGDATTGAELQLDPGVVFTVKSTDQWRLDRGEGEAIVSDDLEYRQGRLGMVLMDEELLRGDFTVSYQDQLIEVLPEQQVVWAEVSNASYLMTLPVGNYYGRIREVEGQRGYSEIVHVSAQPRVVAAQMIPGREQVSLPVYSPLELNGRDFVIGDVPDEHFHWRLAGETELVRGQIYRHPGFASVGTQVLELFIRDGDNDYLAKAFDVNVFLPQLRIDEELFNGSRIIRVETQPPVAGIPVGIVGSRGGVEDWLIANPDQGARLESRYYTDDQGVVQLPALEDLEGMNIVIEDGKKVARLFPNGRVVLYEEYKDSCQNEALLDRDGYLKFRISCLDGGRLVEKFQVRMVPDLDTDVSIVDAFSTYDRGVTVRSLQSAVELTALSSQDFLVPGGVRASIQNGPVLLLLSPDGKVELVERTMTIAQKPFVDGNEPLVWQVLQNELPILEFTIRGPDIVSIVDPVVRETVQGDQDQDGMLDRWEALYGITEPDEDPDLDGLTNLQEFQRGTNPIVSDTDGDGLTDGEEIDPLSSESTQKKMTFSDVPETSPYAEAVKTLSQFGFIQGYEDGTFRPDQPVTRAEALKIIMSVIRCENCEFPSQATKEELDPLMKGIQEFLQFHGGRFNDQLSMINDQISEEEQLKIFSFGQSELTTRDPLIGSYFDVSVEDWYYYCIEIATQLGLVNGYRGFENGENALGKFIPNRGVNIAELMKIVIEAIGESGKQSDRVYGPSDGWWNDSQKNYLAKAEEDLQLLLSADNYADPLRSATRAEVAYAAWRVLKENGALDFDEDGVPNQVDQCPCQMANANSSIPTNGCPVEYGPALPVRSRENLFAGIEITQSLECRCLIVIPADLYTGSQFFAVITGTGSQSDRVLMKSNVLVGEGP